MMLRKDYIMRMLEEFVRVLARIVLLKETKQYVDAKQELDNLSMLVSGFDLNHIKSLGADGVRYVLSLNKESEVEKVYCTARILKEDAMILEAEGNREESLKSYKLSMELFELVSDKEFDEKPEALKEIEFLKEKIKNNITG